ncbi:O-antigen ligase family protein [Pseudomonas donghuensis]|uniref:O-antigen ligase family protein n=1 Tax=Pseudomonas donghuensis TaxID=1163398 RepID=UPI0020C25FE9|nr:O-antigen ligase family protein [Pseudomonas donghuensis]MCP6696606.1 O-antigen ligase family protein [Pseudomonas donghuensis]UVL26991.1 O-antigen ligase family protein [Pseudomonas donghuensis]
MMYARRWAQSWLAIGLLWFVVAIALAPSNKVYQQGLIAFLWLPALVLLWSARVLIVDTWKAQRWLWLSVALLLGWSALSLSWSSVDEGGREVKRLVYIAVFLLFFPMMANADAARVMRLLNWGGVGLAVAAVCSIALFYGVQAQPWYARLYGIGEISHPILGAYVIAAAIIWMLHWPPRTLVLQGAWGLSLIALGMFLLLCQSRGAALALLISVLAMPIWCRDRRSCWIAGAAMVVAIVVFASMQSLIMARGSSYRPEIFQTSLQMIAEHPWTGLGLGAFYRIQAVGREFDHSHNMFTHIAIELGIPGMLLWLAVWLCVLREIWKARDTAFGKGLMGLWLFSTLAMQFDAASLTGTPRAEWFISWLPVGLATVLVWGRARAPGCDKISGSI